MSKQQKQISLESQKRFELGLVVATSGALQQLQATEIVSALRRHVQGDWGVVDDVDKRANEEALREEGRLLSAYLDSAERRFWIITEADRSVTTVLLPEEY